MKNKITNQTPKSTELWKKILPIRINVSTRDEISQSDMFPIIFEYFFLLLFALAG